MKNNVTRKIIRQHLLSGDMAPGSEIAIRIDHTLTHDVTGTQAYVTQGIVANLRALPSSGAESAVLAELQGGTSVVILSTTGNWYQCQANGITGFLHKDCVSAQ